MKEKIGNEELKEFFYHYAALSEFMNDFEELRIKSGLSQKEVAGKIGTTQSAISRIESLKTNPSYKMLHKITDAVDGKLIVSPMGEMVVKVPYSLQDRAKEKAKEANLSVHDYLTKIINDTLIS